MTQAVRSMPEQEGASPRAGRQTVWWTAIVPFALVLSALLALPSQTITSKYVNDLFVFLDGAHRIWSGQVPNVDFHTSLGALTFYIPAVGYGLSGSMGGAMPVGMAIVTLLFAAVAAAILGSRMHKALGLPLAAFLLLLVAAPANPGERIGDLTFAMFYNRLGWSSLGLLLVMYLPRLTSAGSKAVDAACASFLVLFMLYTKITYSVVELAFLVFLATDRRQIGWTALAFGMIAISVIAIELFWRGSLNYLADLRLAGENSGGLPALGALGYVFLNNFADLTVYAIAAGILLVLAPSYRRLFFIGFCVLTGVLLIEQNFQRAGILTLGPSAAVITQSLLNGELSRLHRKARLVLSLLLAFLLVPAAISNASAVAIHARYAIAGQGEPMPLPEFSRIRLVETWSIGQYDYFVQYNRTLAEASDVLSQLGARQATVAVLDFVNPFSAGLALPPPIGDSVWYHWGRTLGPEYHPPAEEMFAHVDLILDPKWPIEIWTANGMRDIFAHYIARHYDKVRETTNWRIYRRNTGQRMALRAQQRSGRRMTGRILLLLPVQEQRIWLDTSSMLMTAFYSDTPRAPGLHSARSEAERWRAIGVSALPYK
ncbi:hypothetical protein [Rhizobium sp. CRRU65]|uniref:hypothetical protein n=1 Tax=Rhizobium sp. CRRU65 TaxID=3399566 RepID=UPI003AF533D4